MMTVRVLLVSLLLSTNIAAQNRIQISPKPVSVKENPGEFKLSSETEIVLWGGSLKQEAVYLRDYLN